MPSGDEHHGAATMSAMAKTATAPGPNDLRKGSEVVARADLRDVPAGTTGKVTMVTGIYWIRYWVRFENGVSLGSINRSRLATVDEWARIQSGEDIDGDTAQIGDETATDATADAADGGGEGKATPSGTIVPQRLLDRSAAARTRLGA